jgi:hypothetical protein
MAKKVKSTGPRKKPIKARRSAGKRKSVKMASRKSTKKPALKVVAKRAKKTAKRGKRSPKTEKRAAKISSRGLRPGSAPTILLLKEGGKIEPVWVKYARMAASRPSKRPGIPTNIRVGDLVSWKTDGGKDRIGIVQKFFSDSAVVGMGGKTELIRIARLTRLSDKAKGS